MNQEDITPINRLRRQATFSLHLFRSLTSEPLSTKRDCVLRHCIERSVELAAGCIQLAEKELPASTTVVARSLLELLFLSVWISQSEENATKYETASIVELRRQARIIAKLGYGRFVDRVTKDDVTATTLNSDDFKQIGKRPRIEDMAKSTGLEEVYKTVYGFVSMIAHANDYALLESNRRKEILEASIEATITIISCIELVIVNWVFHRKITPAIEIKTQLGLN